MPNNTIIEAIDRSPLNRGLRGVDWVADARNVAVMQDDDLVLFDYESEGVYQIHLLLRSKGRRAIDRIREAFRRMFDEYGAKTLFGLVPEFRRDVRLMARWVGGKFAEKQLTEDGPCELFIVAKSEWKGE